MRLAPVVLALAACASTPAPPPAAPVRGLDADLTGYPYPHEVRFHAVRQQGQDLRMAYMDVAPATPGGATVLLLHGKNFSSAYWAETIRALGAAGYRVVAPDQLGFGKSSKPTDLQYSFHALAGHTRSLLDALGVEKVHVVGHSMGGMLATRFALSFPERVGKLVLVNPIGLEDWQRVAPYRGIDHFYELERSATPASVQRYMQDAYFAGRWEPAWDPLVELQAGWLLGPDRERIARVSALTADMIFTQPVLHHFPDLRVPTLLVIGTRDRTAIGKKWAPPEVAKTLGDYDVLGERAAAAIPGAKLVELPGIGHLPQVEAFDAYRDALLSFLAG